MIGKLILFCLSSFILFFPVISLATSSAVNINSGLIAYYPFDGDAYDNSGNGNHGAVFGASLAADRFGNKNNAYHFDGMDDYIEILDSSTLDPSDITVAIWAKPQSLEVNNSYLLSKWKTESGSSGSWMLHYSGTYPAFVATGNGSDGSFSAISASTITVDNYYHFVGTYNAADNKITIYVNGEKKSEVSGQGNLYASSSKILIGALDYLKYEKYFKGTIDDVRIYNRSLSAEEIGQLYSDNTACSGDQPELCETESSCQSVNANWCNNVCQEMTCSQSFVTNTMSVPAVNQVFSYAPIAVPVTHNEPASAFPIGLGSVAENGDLLDLIVGINGFDAPVDIYLGYHATAINPDEIHLFTESGNMQGLYADGISPWIKNTKEPVSAAVLSEFPTTDLPAGTYTAYLMVTPTATLTPSWLWSTAFQHTPIKGVFVNTVKEDKLVMTAVDQNDLYYSFFGEKDDDGVLQYFNQLVLDQRDKNGNFEYYLSIDFDQHGRPVAVTMPDAGGRIFLDYISETEMSVLIEADDGSSDIVVVDNPFSSISSRHSESAYDVSADKKSSLFRSSTQNEPWPVYGEITSCRDGGVPKVNVERELDNEIFKVIPQLALIKTRVFQHDNGTNDPDFSYRYNIQVLPDYDSWKRSCWWNWTGGNIVSTGGKIVGVFSGIAKKLYGLADKLYQLRNSSIKDAKDGTTNNYTRKVTDILGDTILKAWSYTRKIYDLRILPVDAQNGPCSEKIWRYLNQLQTARQTVSCTLKGVTKQTAFTPAAPDFRDDILSVTGPDFDFSDSCDEPEPVNNNCSSPGSNTLTIPGRHDWYSITFTFLEGNRPACYEIVQDDRSYSKELVNLTFPGDTYPRVPASVTVTGNVGQTTVSANSTKSDPTFNRPLDPEGFNLLNDNFYWIKAYQADKNLYSITIISVD